MALGGHLAGGHHTAASGSKFLFPSATVPLALTVSVPLTNSRAQDAGFKVHPCFVKGTHGRDSIRHKGSPSEVCLPSPAQ